MKTDVAIIGGGPSGLLLSQILMRAGISTVVLERRSRPQVLARIRAGVLEQSTVNLLQNAGVGARLLREGIPHEACYISSGETLTKIDLVANCGKHVTVYGQTEVTTDLYAAQDAMQATILHDVTDVSLHDVCDDLPYVKFHHDGTKKRLDCRYIAGCDGFHGVSRQTIPKSLRREYENVYPFAWLGILSRTPPASPDLIYTNHDRGFALTSMRNPMLSRYYIQVPLTDKVQDWSDDAIWNELLLRLPLEVVASIETGPTIEKSISPLRSFVCETMQWGRLYLCGDAAHIVPPTGAKGLNLAVSHVFYLSRALIAGYNNSSDTLLNRYSHDALARIWNAMRFASSLTKLMHRFPDQSDFDRELQLAEFEKLASAPEAQRLFALNYCGTPY